MLAIPVLLFSLLLKGDRAATTPQKPPPELYPDLQRILTEANTAFVSGNYQGALTLYRRGIHATPEHIPYFRAVFLTGKGNCEGLLWKHPEALLSFNDAIELAARYRYRDVLMKAYVGRISVYRHIPGLEAARAAVQQAEPLLREAREPAAILQLANLIRDLDFEKALAMYRSAVLAAQATADNEMIALAWNQLGFAYLLRGDIDEADRALTEAFRLRCLSGRRHMQSTYYYLGWLRRLQGRYEEAVYLQLQARQRSAEGGGIYPFSVDRELARSMAASGDREAALRYYESAVRLAEDSRFLSLPSESFRSAVEEGLHSLFAEYVELGMSEYEETKNTLLASRMFALANASRGTLFRSGLSSIEELPVAYLRKVAEFRQLLARSLAVSDATTEQQLTSLRLELANMEVKIGIRSEKNSPQIFEREGPSIPLLGVQTKLRDTEVLLSYMGASSSSFVWAITKDSFEVHRLPGSAVLAEHIDRYRKSVESNEPDSERYGYIVANDLISAISDRIRSQRDWILSLDAPMFDLPFASLPDPSGKRGERLSNRHSLRFVPAAPGPGVAAPAGKSLRFAGQADAVYNLADSRLSGSDRTEPSASTRPGDPVLPRLPGSARELKRCSAA